MPHIQRILFNITKYFPSMLSSYIGVDSFQLKTVSVGDAAQERQLFAREWEK